MRSALVALAAVLCATAGAVHLLQPSKVEAMPSTPSTPPLRVATYNIHAGIGTDERFDLTRTAQTLQGLCADVIGLQEVDVHWGARSNWRNEARKIAHALDMDVFFAPIYSLPGDGKPRRKYGLAILSSHPIVYTKNHEITQRWWDQVERRSGFAEAVVDVRGSLVHVYATHLDYRDPRVRKTQVAEMLRIMSGDGRHSRQILLGDLNAPPGAPELAPLWDRGGLTDTWRVAGRGPSSTHPTGRIDYIITRSLAATRVKIVKASASDHAPVIATLSSYPRMG